MKHSDSLTKIAPALVAALGKIEGAAKKKTNPGFKSKYADLETVIDASRDILTENGLTLIQLPGPIANGCLSLETILLHESGEFISHEGALPLGKQDPQGAGSALTYLRRYAQMAALNMPAVDDDGEAAHGRGQYAARSVATPNGPPPAATPEPAGRKSAAQAKRDGDDAKIKADINKCDLTGLLDWETNFDSYTAHVPLSWSDPIRDMIELRREELLAGPAKGEAEMDAAFRATVGRPGAEAVAGRNGAVEHA